MLLNLETIQKNQIISILANKDILQQKTLNILHLFCPIFSILYNINPSNYNKN